MNKSIITELESHLRTCLDDGILTLENRDDWHFHAFNEDHYIVGYHQGSEWLKKHDLDAFEAIAYMIEQEELHFGEVTIDSEDINPETVANLVVYFTGFEALSNIEDELIEQLEGDQ